MWMPNIVNKNHTSTYIPILYSNLQWDEKCVNTPHIRNFHTAGYSAEENEVIRCGLSGIATL